jgi:hypothetical protein
VEHGEYARIAAAEDDHWWYRNTRRLMADLLDPWLARDQRILDAGCGPGGNGSWLAGARARRRGPAAARGSTR